MSLDNSNIVDAIGIENDSGCLVLTIADSWEWSDPYAHLVALQSKLNAYFEFITSGQIWEVYPDNQKCQIVIDVIFRFDPPEMAQDLLSNARTVANTLNVIVRDSTYTDSTYTGPATRDGAEAAIRRLQSSACSVRPIATISPTPDGKRHVSGI